MDDDKTVDERQLPTPVPLQPGATISPQQDTTPPQAAPQPELPPVAPAASTPASVPAPAPTPPQPAPAAAEPAPRLPVEPASTQAFAPPGAAAPAVDEDGVVSWTASEFIAHHKSSGWYARLVIAAIVIAAIVFFITKDLVSTAVVVLAGVVLAAYASRPPQQRTYQIGDDGLVIDNKQYSFAEFRSFSVVPEGAFSSITFMPLKRFGVQTTIYYDPQDEDRIVDVLGRYLPHEQRRADPVDQLMRRIRF